MFGIKVSRDIFGTHISKTNKIYNKLSFDDIYKIKIKKDNPIIFDVGANQGQSILRLGYTILLFYKAFYKNKYKELVEKKNSIYKKSHLSY